jgi:hypothetical protein
MKKAWLGVLLVLGTAYGVSAQDDVAVQGRTNTAANFSDTSASQVTLYTTSSPAIVTSSSAAGGAYAAPAATPIPAEPAAEPTPKYVFFGDRDDYRWQLGVGFEYLRFQSSQFNANMFGLNTTLTYFTNTWFAVEGEVVTAFGPSVFPNSTPKMFAGAGGFRIGGRRARWEPFGHALIGGSHLQPQTAAGGRTGLMAQAGLGIDFRVHSRLSLRGEADWLYTNYFSQNQNSVQVVGGVVLHF